MDALKVVILGFILVVAVESNSQSLLELLKEELELLDKRQNLEDDGSSVEYYTKIIKAALRVAKNKRKEYEELKSQDKADDGLTPQKQLDNIHRPKTDPTAYELKGLEREELIIELKNVIGKSIDELNGIKNFTQAYENEVPRKLCPITWQNECKESGRDGKYRREDGKCNNLNNPYWGIAYAAQQRILDPVYEDVVRAARSKASDGSDLTSPRHISNVVFQANDSAPVTSDFTMMFMAWGQFLDHDVTLTPTSADWTEIDCCDEANINRVECLPIAIPDNDGRFNRRCMNFTRSTPGPMLSAACNVTEPRQQMNVITSVIDASNVYGSSAEEMGSLRDKNANNESLATLRVKGNDFPPAGDDSTCSIDPEDAHLFHCMDGGDGRLNVIANLQALHTIFLRLHNWIVEKLREVNNNWSEQKLFQEARRIVAAVIQHITYTEYLPKVLGADNMDLYSLTPQSGDPYDEKLNPTIFNEFAGAAFRFGHSQIGNFLAYLREDRNGTLEERNARRLRNLFNDPSMLQQDNGTKVDELTRFLVHNMSMDIDRFVEEEPRNWMFFEFDIVALNIQRGRDHGFPPYTKYREECGLAQINEWSDLADKMDGETVELLKQVYKSVHDIDLFVGGISEDHDDGASVGPTFACILGRQFLRLKHGDRFWYERDDVMDDGVGFTTDQIDAIKNFKLSAVICNTVEEMGSIQHDVFKQHDEIDNIRAGCSTYEDDFDFAPWGPSKRRRNNRRNK